MSRINLADLIMAVVRTPGALRRRSQERRHRKLMRNAPLFALASMPENTFGKVVGIVRPEGKRLLEAPLSGRLCVYYEAYVDAMAENTMLRTLASEQEGMSFVVDDGNARALVDPAHAYMSTGIDHVSRATLHLMSDREEAFVRRHQLAGRGVPFSDGLRFREAILEVDERIAVFGGGVRAPDPDRTSAAHVGPGDPRAGAALIEPGDGDGDGDGALGAGAYRESMPTRLCFTGTSRFPLFISDDPRTLTSKR